MRLLILLSISLFFFSCDDNSDGISVDNDGNGNGNNNTDSSMVVFESGGTGSPSSYFNDVTYVFVDSQDRAWLGTWEDGVLMHDLNTNETVRFDTEQITGSNFGGIARDFIEANDGTIYIADGGGLCYYDEATEEVKVHDSQMGSLGIFSFTKADDGTIYMGTFEGTVGILDASGNLTTQNMGPSGGAIRSMALDNNGDLWLAGSFTVAKYNGESFEIFDTEAVTGVAAETEEDEINMRSIAIDDQGRPWFSSQEGFHKTYYWDGSKFVLGHDFNETGVTTRVNRHYFYNGDYWIASDNGGIIQVRNNSVYKEWNKDNSDIPDNDCYSLFFKDNRVYFGTNFFENGGWGYITLD